VITLILGLTKGGRRLWRSEAAQPYQRLGPSACNDDAVMRLMNQ